MDENKNVVDSYGWASQADPCSQQYIEPAIIRTLRGLGAHRILDLGCGNGALARQLAKAGFETSGCDADRDGIELARQAGGDFFVASVYDDPRKLDGQNYDAVISTEVIEHLFSPHKLPEFAFPLIKPGGHLLVTTPYHGYLKNLALAALNKWDTHADPFWEGGHIKFFSRKTLEKLLAQSGFSITEFQGLGRFPYLWKSMLVVARKPDGGKPAAPA